MVILEIPASQVFLGADAQLLWTSLAAGPVERGGLPGLVPVVFETLMIFKDLKIDVT